MSDITAGTPLVALLSDPDVTISVTGFPTNTSDDWLLVQLSLTGTPIPSITGLDGFTRLITDPDTNAGGGSPVRGEVLFKKSSGGETGASFTVDASCGYIATPYVITGADGTTLFDVIGTVQRASGADPIAPGITTLADGQRVLAFAIADDDDAYDAAPSQGTYVSTSGASGISGDGASSALATLVKATAGATGDITLNRAGTAEEYLAFQAAIKEPAGADTQAPTHGAASLDDEGLRDLDFTLANVNDNAATDVTVYGVVVPTSEATPTQDQIIAGTDASDTPLTGRADSVVVSAPFPKDAALSFTGIDGTVDNKLCITAVDDAATPNKSAVATLLIPAVGASEMPSAFELATSINGVPTSNTEFALLNHPGAANRWAKYVGILKKAGNAYDAGHFRVVSHDAAGNFVIVWESQNAPVVADGDLVTLQPSSDTVKVEPLTSAEFDASAVAALQNGLALDADMDAANAKLNQLDSDGAGGVKLSDSGVAGIYVGTVGASPTTTTMVLSGGVAFDGQHKGSIFKLLDGPVAGLLCKITASVAATDTVTFEVLEDGGALPFAPVQGNVYKIG